jgi:uncharacterized protein (DUF1330 family)
MPTEPDEVQLAAAARRAGAEGDGPLVMLNLNRYVPGGHEAYLRYGEVAVRVLARVGGSLLWHTSAPETVIGDDGDRYDEIIAVWYPSWEAFLALAGDPELVRAAEEHRRGALEKATLICVPSDGQATLMPGA